MATTTTYGTVIFEGKAYTLTNDAYLTNRVFPGCWNDVSDGEEYASEWESPAVDGGGNEYLVRWQFSATKGEEPEDDNWPWGDDDYVTEVVAL